MAIGNLAPIIPAIFTGPNGERLTPDQIKRRQEIAESLMAQATDTSPNAGGWASIAAKGLAGFQAGRERRSADNASSVNAAASQKNITSLLGNLVGGSPVAAPAIGGLPAMAAGTGVGAEMAATAPGVAGATIPATADAQQIRQGLINRGLPEHVADGFLVNFQDESGLNPGINEANPTVPGSRGGFGLYQLTGPRRVAYESFAQERGVDPSDVDAQLDFLMTELQGPEKAAAERIMAAGDTPMAAQAIVNHFLRPAPEHRERRMAAYSQLGASPAVMTDAAPAGLMPGYQDPMVASPNASPVAAALAAQPAAAPQQMAQAMPQQMAQASAPTLPPINPAVIETLSSPYASPEEKAVAQALLGDYQQQKAQVEKQALAQQQRQMEIARRQGLAPQLGINPVYAQDDALWEGAAGNIFAPPSTSTVNGAVIDNRTGQPIYQAPTETYRQVYGEEAAAMGLDPSKAYNIGPNGEVRPIGEGGVVVNNNMGNDKFGEEFAKLDASALNTVSTAGLAAQRNLGRINQLDELLKSSPTGLAGAAAQRAGEWGINTEGLDTLQAAQAAINSLVPEQRQPGSGPMSDADLALFKQSLPRIINQPGGNQLIIGTMRSIAEYDAQGAQIVQQLRDNKLTRAQAFEMLQARPNPLESFKVPEQGEDPLPPQTNGRRTSTGATWEIIE